MWQEPVRQGRNHVRDKTRFVLALRLFYRLDPGRQELMSETPSSRISCVQATPVDLIPSGRNSHRLSNTPMGNGGIKFAVCLSACSRRISSETDLAEIVPALRFAYWWRSPQGSRKGSRNVVFLSRHCFSLTAIISKTVHQKRAF